jgi:hypothetical protein
MPAKPLDPAIAGRFLYMADVERKLGRTENAVLRLVRDAKLPMVRREGRRLFPKEAAERAIAKILEEEGGAEMEQGQRDARAVAMLRDGHSDGEVVMELELSLERVRDLRASLRPELAKTKTEADEGSQRRLRRAERDRRWMEQLTKQRAKR